MLTRSPFLMYIWTGVHLRVCVCTCVCVCVSWGGCGWVGARQRPGIFKGAAASWEALQLWTPNHMAQTASDRKVSTGDIPYAEEDGRTGTIMPLAGFLMAMLGINEAGEQAQHQPHSDPPGRNGVPAPAYLFDAQILDEINFGGVHEVPMLKEDAMFKNKQFMIGQV